MTPAEWRFTRADLEQVGFLGWTPADELTRNALPKGTQGVYIAYRRERSRRLVWLRTTGSW